MTNFDTLDLPEWLGDRAGVKRVRRSPTVKASWTDDSKVTDSRPRILDVPSADARAEALLDEIGELYAILLRMSRRLTDDEPMTATQRLALIEIAIIGPLRLRNLASRMDTTPATASRAVDTLEEFGFAERRSDPRDGRAILIGATPKGRRWVERRRASILDVLKDVGTDVAPPRLTTEIARLNASLREATGHDEVARGALLAP